MNNITVFDNNTFGSIRTVEKDGKVLFCGSDVAKALGYSDTAKAIKLHCKEDGWEFRPVIDSLGREQQAKFIDEGNLYRLITHSKLPGAEQFEHWVFDEILPSIRKHGAYMTEKTLEEAILNPDYLIQLATALKNEQMKRKALEAESAVQKQQIAELQPKASYYDVVLNCKDLLSITEIAKDYGKSGTWLNRKLHELGVQFRQGKIWLLYQKYAEKGYTSTKTHTYPAANGEIHTKVHTYWTQKGRLFIYALLKNEGILPLIEQDKPETVEETA